MKTSIYFAFLFFIAEVANAGCLLQRNENAMKEVCTTAMASGLYSETRVSPTCGILGLKWIQIANKGMCGCCVLRKEAPAGAANTGGGLFGAITGGYVNVIKSPVCVTNNKKEIYNQLKTTAINDKYIHCSLSCVLKKRCGNFAATTAGYAKEVQDLFDDKKYNSFGSGDLFADQKGLDFAPLCGDENCCYAKCNEDYPKNMIYPKVR